MAFRGGSGTALVKLVAGIFSGSVSVYNPTPNLRLWQRSSRLVSIEIIPTNAGEFPLNRINGGPQALLLSNRRQGASAFLAAMVLAMGLVTTGCGEKPFARVNGQTITMEEYVKALERQPVQVPGGGQSVNAERLVIDQLIGNKIILDEASKQGVLPTDAEVTNFFEFRKKLFQAQYPDKTFEEVIKEQGSTPEEIKKDIRVQLAETNVYAKRLKITEDDTRKAFEQFRGQYLPSRVSLRFILTMPNSPEFAEAKKLLAAKTPFEQVAKKVNLLPNLKASGGRLSPSPVPDQQVPSKIQNEVRKATDGTILGPVDLDLQPGAPPFKAWVLVEKKYPAFTVNYDDSRADVLRQLVQARIQDPANASVRRDIMKLKMNATFEPSTPSYGDVWNSVKKQAQESGLFDESATPATAVAPTGGAPTAAPAATPAATPPVTKNP